MVETGKLFIRSRCEMGELDSEGAAPGTVEESFLVRTMLTKMKPTFQSTGRVRLRIQGVWKPQAI